MKKIITIILILFLCSCFPQKTVVLKGYLEFPRDKIVACLRTESDCIPICYDIFDKMNLSRYEGKFVEIKGTVEYIGSTMQISPRNWFTAIDSIKVIEEEKINKKNHGG